MGRGEEIRLAASIWVEETRLAQFNLVQILLLVWKEWRRRPDWPSPSMSRSKCLCLEGGMKETRLTYFSFSVPKTTKNNQKKQQKPKKTKKTKKTKKPKV